MRGLMVAFMILLAVPAVAAPVLDIDFTAAEGFSDGAGLAGTQGMEAQGTWVAGDTAGTGYATSVGSWQRARNLASFTLDV